MNRDANPRIAMVSSCAALAIAIANSIQTQRSRKLVRITNMVYRQKLSYPGMVIPNAPTGRLPRVSIGLMYPRVVPMYFHKRKETMAKVVQG